MHKATNKAKLSKSEISEILAIFDREFPESEMEIPLRHRNGFELLIAVILSAQCTDARVNTITPLLFPASQPCTPQHILNLGAERVREIIHPCGYYNAKGKAIMGCAEILAKKMQPQPEKLGPDQKLNLEALPKTKDESSFTAGGKSQNKSGTTANPALAQYPYPEIIPSDFKALTALPGVGPKTAQVIQAQWFNMDAFPVDTHINRICNRLGLADAGKNADKTERQVKAQVPKKNWSRLHLQMIFHGRKTCKSRKPKCNTCPLRKVCKWEGKDIH
jgi:endonuclease III